MFQAISWSAYWTVIGILSLAYYLGVYLFYFRGDFSIQWPKKSKANTGTIRLNTADDVHNRIDNVKTGAVYENCRHEIESLIEQGSIEKKDRNEMMAIVSRIIQKYPALHHSNYRHELESFIRAAFDNYCGIRLDKEEMARVW